MILHFLYLKASKPITVPPYNPLDREGSIIKLQAQDVEQMKTYPYAKEKMVTVKGTDICLLTKKFTFVKYFIFRLKGYLHFLRTLVAN